MSDDKHADKNEGAMVGAAIAAVALLVGWLIYLFVRIIRSGALSL